MAAVLTPTLSLPIPLQVTGEKYVFSGIQVEATRPVAPPPIVRKARVTTGVVKQESALMQQLRARNETIRTDRRSAEQRRDRFICAHLDSLEPFLDDQIVQHYRSMPPAAKVGLT